jgi:Ser/Thr protein kinase RdoA (MazF antagonist)
VPSMSQVRTWLAAWDLAAPLQVDPVGGGFTSHVWHVQAGGRHYIAKLAYEPQQDVENGLRAAAILSRHGQRTGSARQTSSGDLRLTVEHPPARHHALALLEYVDGEALDWGTPEALRIAGETLGTVHRVLLVDGSLDLPDQLFGYLQHHAAWGTHPDLQPLIDRAIVAVRAFEASHRVTYGPIYDDGLQLRLHPRDGRVGVIDWGTVSYGLCRSISPWQPTAPALPVTRISGSSGLATWKWHRWSRRNWKAWPPTLP